MSKGKLINVEISRGRYVKMYESDAIAQGLVKPPPVTEKKLLKKPQDKMRKPSTGSQMPANKAGQRIETDERIEIVDPSAVEQQAIMVEIAKLVDGVPPPEEPMTGSQPIDDIATIPGVGKASVRALQAHGVETFEQLKLAQDLDYLPAKVLAAIAEWRLVACDQTERG